MSGFHQDSEAVEAIRDQQEQLVQTSDVAVGEGGSAAEGALSQGTGVLMAGKGKGLSTILCCLCGRPIQPNGEDIWLETEFETISISKRYNGYEFYIRDDVVQYQNKLRMPENKVQNKFDIMYRKPRPETQGTGLTWYRHHHLRAGFSIQWYSRLRYPSVPLVGGRNCDVDNLGIMYIMYRAGHWDSIYNNSYLQAVTLTRYLLNRLVNAAGAFYIDIVEVALHMFQKLINIRFGWRGEVK